MRLSIIIISWNVREKLEKNLQAIYQSQRNFDHFEVFVVDNNSSDNSVEMVAKKFPQVKLIINQENLGFSRANNQALRQASGDFILLLNPDMQVMPDTLVNMINWMIKNKQASVAGCNLVNQDGKTIQSVRRFPTIWDQLAIVLKLPFISSKVLKKYLQVNFDYNRPSKVDSIRGGFFMVRNTRPVIPLSKINFIHHSIEGAMFRLDERYFLWFEEVDFCRQVYQNKGEVWYTPTVKCVDYVGQSFKQIKSTQKQKYFRDSMLKYFKKWHPKWQYYILWILWPIGLFLTWLGEKVGIKKRAAT